MYNLLMSKRKANDNNLNDNDSDNDNNDNNNTFNNSINSEFRGSLNSLDFLKTKKFRSNDWISGTTVANHLNGEPLIDWLKLYYDDYHFNEGRVTRSIKRSGSGKFTQATTDNPLLSNGLLFEKCVYDDLKLKFGNAFYKVCDSDIDFDVHCEETMRHINLKTPIIAQAVLVDESTKLRGIVDLLVRSDFINKIFKRKVIEKSEYKKNGGTYYIVVDIKWTSMTLCVDGRTIRNEGRFKSYKGQLFIYNYLIGKIQNYTPPVAVILAKNWKIDKKNNPEEGFSCYDIAGIIDYVKKDNMYIKKTCDAIEWIHKVRTEGLQHTPLNPTIKEMCVNSSNHFDNGWGDVKKEILKHTKDITQVWFLTQKHRDYAFGKKIRRWDDKNCTTSKLNMTQSKTTNTIDKILEINRQNKYKILPKTRNDIKDNRFNWKTKYPTDFYIDFETLSEQVGKLANINIYDSKMNTQIIFMIGVGYEYNGKFNYKCFKMNYFDINEEKRIVREFKQFIDQLTTRFDVNDDYCPRLFHWSHAERSMLENSLTRHTELLNMWENQVMWVDLCDIFIKEPIVVKGALCFKLKEIAQAMFSHGLINTSWADIELNDGFTAMVNGMKYYMIENKTEEDEKIIVEIQKYNEIDCKVLWEILKYLRNM